MKRLFSLLIVLAIMLGLCSCGAQSTPDSEEPKESTQITLTTDNIKDYLIINGQYGKIERQTKVGIDFGYSDFTINVDPSIPGNFYNASITLKIELTYGWDVSSSDPAFSDNDGYLTTTIKLPSNGSKEEIHDLIASIYYKNHDNQNINIEVTSVSGTFVPG